MKWVRLKIANDWGTDCYYREDDPSCWSKFETFRAPNLKFDDEIRVRWPDGTESVEKIHYRSVQSGYSDHGRETSFSYSFPVIRPLINGVESEVTLDKVEIWLPELEPVETAPVEKYVAPKDVEIQIKRVSTEEFDRMCKERKKETK